MDKDPVIRLHPNQVEPVNHRREVVQFAGAVIKSAVSWVANSIPGRSGEDSANDQPSTAEYLPESRMDTYFTLVDMGYEPEEAARMARGPRITDPKEQLNERVTGKVVN